MRTSRVLLLALPALALLAGCATATTKGQVALSTGRYVDAAGNFQEALDKDPGDVTDLVGLGVARYKLGALEEAAASFKEALTHTPDLATAHAYLAMIGVRRAQDPEAVEHLERFLALGPPPRLAAHVDRTVRLLRDGLPPNPVLREYVAASLEDGYQWSGEIAAAQAAVYDAQLRWYVHDRVYLLPRACRCR